MEYKKPNAKIKRSIREVKKTVYNNLPPTSIHTQTQIKHG